MVRHRKKQKKQNRGDPNEVRCVPHDKQAFTTKHAAISALARYVTRPGEYKPRRAYPDKVCGYWHLTSRL